MAKERLAAIEYIRGISMLGVVGIHTGSQYLLNPSCNVHLVALLEICTRFAVPIFFFISAFGLFYHMDTAKFNYRKFLARRFQTVFVPYLAWSFFYIAHYSVFYRDTSFLHIGVLAHTLFFGMASYHLYFLVILLWFYLLMPLWIFILRRLTAKRAFFLLITQLVFNFYSSYILRGDTGYPALDTLIDLRLNYLVLHYVFIFLLGGWCAVNFGRFSAWLRRRVALLFGFFAVSLAVMLAHYYYLLYAMDYSPLSCVNTVHQLSPDGVFYTIAASLFFFGWFTYGSFPSFVRQSLAFLGKHSYFVYLVHPFVIFYVSFLVGRLGFVMTAPVTVCFYCIVVAVSVSFAVASRRLGARFPLVNLWSIGVSPKKRV